jgi:hypothetical protein
VTARFPYERVEAEPSFADPSPFVYRPVVPVTVVGLSMAFPTKGLLDTGATETVLPAYLFENGLIDPAFREGEEGLLFGADGRPFRVVYGTVDLAIRLGRKVRRWHAKVAFHPTRKDVLLGDAGFLRYFTATFNRHERYATLRPTGKFPPPIMPVSALGPGGPR